MDLLQVKSISKQDERGFHLSNINFNQAFQQNITIAGETGSGKTTLLKIIAGLAQPDMGEIIFRNEKVIGPADKLIPGHKGIVYLSQDFRLPHFLRVEQILEYANEWPTEKAEKLFSLCGIRHLFKRRTDELSGGEQQRIAIARLLIMDPQLFLLDEPFSNMDPANKDLLKNIIKEIGKEFNMSFIMISHDPVDTLPWADEIIVMRDGKLIEKNSPELIYSKPAFAYTAALFGKYNVLPVGLLQMLNNNIKIPSGFQPIVRPEKCVIISSSVAGNKNIHGEEQVFQLKGKVVDVRYFGHYFETDLMIGDHTFISRSHYQGSQPGNEETIEISGQDVHMARI
ncbi:ABC transporter ATP-binding protein [Flavitalea sp.]|nr:ABC transporter ATP-binding protein [Flavitalea sp.]